MSTEDFWFVSEDIGTDPAPESLAVDEEWVRVMGLHSLTYCERLYYLEEVEGLLVANERVYAGRSLHKERTAPDETGRERRSLWLTSERLGLYGRVDVVRTRDGQPIPYEHKRGRVRRGANGEPEAWPSDLVQLGGYALLLEEQMGRPVLEGRIRYHADQVTVRVPITESLRAQVLSAIARAKELRTYTTRPPVIVEESKCAHCSLAPVCLPEEERLVEGTTTEPGRLFPPHPDREIVHVNAQGARIRRTGEQLVIEGPGAERVSLPIHTVDALVLHGNVQLTTQAVHLCASHEVGIHWLTRGGRYLGGLAAGSSPVQRRIRQYQALTDPRQRLDLARRLVTARLDSQLRFHLRATHTDPAKRTAIREAIQTIRQQRAKAGHAADSDTLRGYEGLAGRAYFAALPHLLDPEIPETMRPSGRSRRPPQDRFNALLSFGYALLYRSVLAAVLAVGLEPAFGFFHTPRSTAHPLVLDLMELFRVPLWDMVVIASCNRRQWDPEVDFHVARDHVWLSDEGRRKAITLYERRLEDTWKHPVLQYSLSYTRTIELEVRLLEKEWTGAPGMFARARLR